MSFRSAHLSWPLAALALAAVGCGSGSPSGAGAARSTPASGRVPQAQIAALARSALAGLGDPHVRTALAMRTTRGRAGAYAIVLRGHFVCGACKRPAGASAPRGRVWSEIWAPGGGVRDSSLTRRMPSGLRRLHKRARVRVAGPHAPAGLTAVQPESGVGPARIGGSLATLDRTLAPALLKLRSGGSYAFGPLQVDVRAGSAGRVQWVALYSSAATIQGHRLSEGFARLRVALQGWKASFCGSSGGTQVLTHASSGLWTRIEFAGNRFENLTIGRPNADPCL